LTIGHVLSGKKSGTLCVINQIGKKTGYLVELGSNSHADFIANDLCFVIPTIRVQNNFSRRMCELKNVRNVRNLMHEDLLISPDLTVTEI
jgi:hypothetical protein